MSLFDGRRLAAVATMTAGLVLGAAPAHAWYVDVTINGAGRVYETTDANEIDEHCPQYPEEGFSSPAVTPTGVLGASCRAGDAGGDYGHGWVVRYVAEAAPGYRFAGWRSAGESETSVKCDGSNGSPNYSGVACQFATFENLHTQAVFVDDTAPAMGSLAGPITQVNGAASFSFDAAPDPTLSHFQCRLVAGGEAQIHDWNSCSSGHQEDPAVAGTEGSYKLYVRAVDRSGNVSTPSAVTWVVDKIKPETTLVSGPVGPTASTSATFSFSGSVDVASYVCTLDNVLLAGCQSPMSFNLGQGGHTFTVAARDDAGNVDASPLIRSWTVDTIAPDTTITSGPGEGSVLPSRSASFGFSGTEAGTFECQLDGAGWSSCEPPRSFNDLSEGAHTLQVQVRARDAAGNLDASPATRSWTVDVPIPALPPASASVAMAVHAKFRHHVSGGRTTVRTLKLTGLPAGASVTVSCASKRKGCAFASKTLQPGGAAVRLTKLFKGGALSPGAVIQIRITAAGYTPDVFRYKTRKGSKPPTGGEVT
ncbi:hypothetical protein FHP29_15735 [Nocardioides albidus]|uniref:Bacterial repeat domain-containing protein n=1 Tax=Nocardioides albidus TaxID=1517589 RepID=A0A5C4VNW3_9ACTN|nr:hypothetical protein [Nocardioides albidus]TNM37295.1 hypothetical protein FHP29_15735 [Nocardioides albidus]